MKTNAMESLHRSVVSKFNETRGRFPFIYYRDVEVEPAILPLVELLNNEWSLSDPLRSRFVQCLTLEPYSDDELTRILLDASGKMGFSIVKGVALEVARRSRSTARNAIMNLRWLVEYCEGTGSKPGQASINEAFSLKEIDPNGLTKVDMAYLSALVEAGSPLGVATIAAAVMESEDTILLAVEPFLLRGGWVRKTAPGRVATQKAFELVGTSRDRTEP